MKDYLIAIGEALIDFIPDKTGCNFDMVTSFSPFIGGAPANVCGAFSRLGGGARMITQLGDDAFGHKIKSELEDNNIDTSCIAMTNKANTALAFVSLGADGNRTFSFYRKPSADMLMTPEQLDAKCFDNAFALHFGSVSLGNFPMKSAHKKAIELARENNAIVSFDPNLRFALWEDEIELKEAVEEFLPLADILKVSDEELEFIAGTKSIDAALPTFFNKGISLVIYTCGKDGAYAFTKKSKAFSPSKNVTAIDTTGAGDGFIGSFLWKLHEKSIDLNKLADISENELLECLSFSNSFCALSVGLHGAICSYPTIEKMKQN